MVGEFGIIKAGIRNQKQEIRNDSKFRVECLGFRGGESEEVRKRFRVWKD